MGTKVVTSSFSCKGVRRAGGRGARGASTGSGGASSRTVSPSGGWVETG